MNKIKQAAAGLFIVAGLVPIEVARAQNPSPLPEWIYSAGVPLRSSFEPVAPEWDVILGLTVEQLPRYPGSSRYKSEIGPLVDVRYRDLAFASVAEGVGINLARSKSYRLGISVTYDLGRPEHAAAVLRGLGDIAACPEIKTFAEYVLYPVVFRADVRRALGGYGGWMGDVGTYFPVLGTDKLFLFLGPSLSFASSEALQSYFGVSPTQSQASGLPAFSPGAGFSSASFGVDGTWLITDQWILGGSAGVERLFPRVASSPIVEERLQGVANLSLGYNF